MLFFGNARIRAFDERLEKVERKLKALDEDWAEVQDKVGRWMHRTKKRVEIDTQETAAPPDEFAHLDPVSADLMRRRRRMNGLRNE